MDSFIGQELDLMEFSDDNSSLLHLDIKTIKALILSPGPGKPSDAGLMPKIIAKYYKELPILV